MLFTSPGDGAVGVPVYATPYLGNAYHPAIWAQFDEPIDETSLTPASFYLADPDGNPLDGVIEFDRMLNRASFILNEPLARNTSYTLTLTTEVHDTSGNPLAEDYQWSFITEASHIYLPLTIR